MIIDLRTVRAEAAQVPGFPAHGWTSTSVGVKVLCLPIRGTFTTWHLEAQGGLPSGVPLERAGAYFWSFQRTLHDLGVVLRELKRLQRRAESSARPLEEVDDDTFNQHSRALELARPALDLAFVYLRRLADRFAGAARFVLFAHPRSAPTGFKKLRDMITNTEKLQRVGPRCDQDALRAIFRDDCSWFERLRGGLTEEHGLRDMLEHHPVDLRLGVTRHGGGPWAVGGQIFRQDPPRISGELFSSLTEITAGLCAFWSRVQLLMEARNSYRESDWLVLCGLDDDSTGFWPEIRVKPPAQPCE